MSIFLHKYIGHFCYTYSNGGRKNAKKQTKTNSSGGDSTKKDGNKTSLFSNR